MIRPVQCSAVQAPPPNHGPGSQCWTGPATCGQIKPSEAVAQVLEGWIHRNAALLSFFEERVFIFVALSPIQVKPAGDFGVILFTSSVIEFCSNACKIQYDYHLPLRKFGRRCYLTGCSDTCKTQYKSSCSLDLPSLMSLQNKTKSPTGRLTTAQRHTCPNLNLKFVSPYTLDLLVPLAQLIRLWVANGTLYLSFDSSSRSID